MKTKSIILGIALTLLACVLESRNAQAGTIDVYVNPSTWAITQIIGNGTAWYNGTYDVAATGATNQYGYPINRYYTYGKFTAVNFYRSTDSAFITSLGGCNKIFYIDRTAATAYSLSNGYNGTGNGTDNEIYVGTAFAKGDFYIGGSFSVAGGYSHTQHFSCYRWSSGWSGVNNVEADGDVTGFSFSSYDLVVSGAFSHVYGPTYSGGPITTVDTPSNTISWDNWNRTFPDAFWK